MADVAIKKGFVCPECRLVIAAPMLESGYAAQCPGCNASLKVPSLTNMVPPIEVVQQSKYALASPNSRGRSYQPRRNESWLDDLPKELLAERSRGLPWHMLAPAGVLGLFLFVGLLFLLVSTVTPTVKKDVVLLEEPEQVASTTELEVEIVYPSATREQVSAYLKKLVAVTTTDELVPLVRKLQGVEDRIKSYYSNDGNKLFDLSEKFVFEQVLGRPGVYLLNIA